MLYQLSYLGAPSILCKDKAHCQGRYAVLPIMVARMPTGQPRVQGIRQHVSCSYDTLHKKQEGRPWGGPPFISSYWLLLP